MFTILYFLKLLLLSTQIQRLNIVRDSVLQKLIRFTNFCVVIYVPWWITSPLASEASTNNFNFIQPLFAYVNELCPSTELKAFFI